MTGRSGLPLVSKRSPKVGLFLPTGKIMLGGATAGWTHLLELTRRAEDLGFDSV
ncbi:MAG: LLM class flavin-dependent oxidoreductase [Chloroflexota bacterium]|nr:LLM class flavin-dependent oxidoreductase [Chloroflexota bacterium]